MTTGSVRAISTTTTEAITGVTALQLLEEGRLDLDAPASEDVPALGEVQVLEGFDASGPVLRAPRRPVTAKHLLLHTAGFSYDFFQEDHLRLATDFGQPSVVTATRQALESPLLFDPGERRGVRQQHRLTGPGRRGDRRDAAGRGHAGAGVRAARHDRLRLRPARRHARAEGDDAPARGGRHARRDRLRAARARGRHAPGEPVPLDRPPQRRRRIPGTQIFPFADPLSVDGHLELETATYGALGG